MNNKYIDSSDIELRQYASRLRGNEISSEEKLELEEWKNSFYERLKLKTPLVEVTKVFEYEASHYLPCYKGDCGRLHGHTYKIEVTLRGEIDKDNGFLMDFKRLKELVNCSLGYFFDHKHLNDFLLLPTAENLVHFSWAVLEEELGDMLEKIVLWETPTSFATLTRELVEKSRKG